MGFFGDLVNRPAAAIETIREKKNRLKSVVLIAVTGALVLINFFFAHFTGRFPDIIIFALLLGVAGIIFMAMFITGFAIDLYIFLKLTKYKPAGEASKTATWTVLIPMLIFHCGFLLINMILRLTGTMEWAGYLYDTLKYLMYIWILGLAIVSVIQNQPEHKSRNILGVIGMFTLNWVIYVYVNLWVIQWLFTTVGL
ncbi:MAG: hypothetical protein HWN66_08700 [Candidatus Helarchaeota archaeon]|nr:hypothetical protein [Candidatus Helarchaeota archaeon]